MTDLKRCGCGNTPERLYLTAAETRRWAYAYGSCCKDWLIEVCVDYYDLNSKEAMECAVKMWNSVERNDE